MLMEKRNSGWRIYEKRRAADPSFLRERKKQNISSDSWLWISKTITGGLGQKSESNVVFEAPSPASPKTNDDRWSLWWKLMLCVPALNRSLLLGFSWVALGLWLAL